MRVLSFGPLLHRAPTTPGNPNVFTRFLGHAAPASTEGALDLKARLRDSLTRRIVCWIFTILLANAAMVAAAYIYDAYRTRAPFNGALGFAINLPIWTVGVWAISAIGLIIFRLTAAPAQGKGVTHQSFVWFIFVLILSTWWTLGMFALQNPKPTNPPTFVLSQRTFVWMTALGHVATVVLLSTNWLVLASALLGGFFLPVIANMALGAESNSRVSIIWLAGQMATYLLVGLFLKIEQKSLLSQQISLESMKQKLTFSNKLLEREKLRADQLLRQSEQHQKKLQGRQKALKAERQRASELLRQNEIDKRKLMLRQQLLETEQRRANDLLYQRNHLLASFSHDLRSPMTALSTGLDNLRDKLSRDATPSEIDKAIHFAESQVSAMADMVNTALDLARVEAGQYPVTRQEIDVRSVIEQVTSELTCESEKKGLELRSFSPSYIGFSDRDALVRIVSNLVSNAIKYTESTSKKNGHVLVGCQRRGNLLKISILDNGMGIDAAELDNIFKEYVQISNPERDRKKGIGLGLSIVSALANLLQHKVEVRSTLGVGSKFSISIPYLGKIPANPVSSASGRLSAPDLCGMTVGLLEDNRDLRDVMTERLQSWGCEVIGSESGKELLSLLREDPTKIPQLIIADYRLRNGKTGVDAVKEVRTTFPQVRCMILSGEVTASVLSEVAAAGIAFMSKPISRSQLIELLLSYHPNNEARS